MFRKVFGRGKEKDAGRSPDKPRKDEGAVAPAAAPIAQAPLLSAHQSSGGHSLASSGSQGNVDLTHQAGAGGDDLWKDVDASLTHNANGGKVSTEDFELLTVVGKGSFGKVMQVRKKDNQQVYAMKVLRKEAIVARKQVAHTRAEKSILQKIHHPFIITLHWAFQTDDKLYLILDFVNGGELFSHLKREGRFSEQRVVLYAAEIVLALSHLHAQDIVYRDLKPENILIDADGHIVITDFGLSKEIAPEEGTQTFCGTPEYLAPEILEGLGHGTPVDWWSLGTLIFEMLTGLPPFYSQNLNIMYQQILNAPLNYPRDVHISPEAKSLLEGLLTRDPARRLGSANKNAAEIKAHPFFRNIDWERLYRKEIDAPFKPTVNSNMDVTWIDPVFKSEQAIDSVVNSSRMDVGDSDSNPFQGFTWQGHNQMEAAME